MVNDYSDEGKLRIVPYDTRYRPVAPPETGIFDEPTAQVCLNVEWIAHIDGALERLLWRDAWDGDLAAQLRAVAEIRKLLSEIHRRLPCCDCEDDMNCEQLIECLQPMFDNINTRLDTIEANIQTVQETVESVQQTQQSNSATMPEPQTSEDGDALCGGATALVDYMHRMNMDVYNDAEYGLVDEVYEAIPIFIDEVPLLEWLPFDELYDLVNTHFANQVVDYQDDYDLIKDLIICDLKCLIEANDGEFTFDLWAAWLVSVGENYPGNRAASVFSRYAPTSMTFANQIAAFVSQEQSLQSYFNQLNAVYYAGLQTPVTCACACPEPYCISLTAGNGLETVFQAYTVPGFDPQAQWSGTGWQANPAVAGRISLDGDFGQVLNLNKIEVFATAAVTAGTDNYQQLSETGGTLNLYEDAAELATFEFSPEDIQYTFLDRVPSSANALSPAVPGEIYEIRLYGNGTPPEIGTPC